MTLPNLQVKPEAKTYYELSAATLRFKFPEPGFLDGIKGKTQAIAKVTNVSGASGWFAVPFVCFKLPEHVCAEVKGSVSTF